MANIWLNTGLAHWVKTLSMLTQHGRSFHPTNSKVLHLGTWLMLFVVCNLQIYLHVAINLLIRKEWNLLVEEVRIENEEIKGWKRNENVWWMWLPGLYCPWHLVRGRLLLFFLQSIWAVGVKHCFRIPGCFDLQAAVMSLVVKLLFAFNIVYRHRHLLEETVICPFPIYTVFPMNSISTLHCCRVSM